MGYIYCIYCKQQPVYVGQTNRSIQERWKEHLYHAKQGDGFGIHAFMKQQKLSDLHIELLEETDRLNEAESYWIESLGTHISKDGYNMTTGGQQASSTLNRACYQYSLDGSYLKSFESVSSAAREVSGVSQSESNILKVLYGQLRTAYGYRWSYKKYDKLEPLPNNYTGSSKRVGQYDLDGHLLHIYSSTKEAARVLNRSQGNISSAAMGKRKTAYGYKWRYID